MCLDDIALRVVPGLSVAYLAPACLCRDGLAQDEEEQQDVWGLHSILFLSQNEVCCVFTHVTLPRVRVKVHAEPDRGGWTASSRR